MDVDASTPEHDLLSLFDTTPENFAWRSPLPQEIEARRVQLSDVLIFDHLLANGGIKYGNALYPPTDVDTLRRLLDAIVDSAYDTLKQDCLIYFLLKWHRDGRELRYSKQRCILPQFVALADACWYLDSGIDIPKAIGLLSDRRIQRDFPSKVIQILSLTNTSTALIRQYVRTVQPPLLEPNDIDMYTLALADSSLMEAWQYQRSYSESVETRKRLLHKILDWCLIPKPKPEPLRHLLAFPFSSYEQAFVRAYALNPPSYLPRHSISVIQDLVCLRLVQGGQYAAAITLDRQFPFSFERRQTMDEITSLMPAAERLLLEVELEELAQGKGASSASGSIDAWQSASDLSMSWENVRVPPESASAPSSPVKRMPRFEQPPARISALPLRAGAPRSGVTALAAAPKDDMFASFMRSSQPEPHIPPPTSISAPPRSLFRVPTPPREVAPLMRHNAVVMNPVERPRPVPRPGALFEQVGSANQRANAFYEPPPVTGKRAFGQDEPLEPLVLQLSPQKPLSPEKPAPQPASNAMDVQEEQLHPLPPSANGHAHPVDAGAAMDVDAEPAPRPQEQEHLTAEFNVSVFGHPAASDSVSAGGLGRPKSMTHMFPGAYIPDSDGEHEQEYESVPLPSPSPQPQPKPTSGQRKEQQRASRSPSPPSAHTRSGRRQRRSIPGALHPEEDSDEEEEDTVPPLPSAAGPRRSSRRSRTNSEEPGPAHTTTKPRRSSRLTAASQGEDERDNTTPAKGRRRSTRTPTGPTPARTTRKKR